jgi:hypothetical protein
MKTKEINPEKNPEKPGKNPGKPGEKPTKTREYPACDPIPGPRQSRIAK